MRYNVYIVMNSPPKKVYRIPDDPRVEVTGSDIQRRHPRSYFEWKTLKRWGKLPEWEWRSPGYLLREAREASGLTQAALAGRLGVSQQAVAQAERWDSNPTIGFVDAWARRLNGRLCLDIELSNIND